MADPKYPPADPQFIPKKSWEVLIANMKRGRRNHQERMEMLLRWQDSARREFKRTFPDHAGV